MPEQVDRGDRESRLEIERVAKLGRPECQLDLP
jgi:hypothetical protein